MSHLLWKYYWENDVDRFRRLLAPAGHSQNTFTSRSPGGGSPGAFGSSPRVGTKSRKPAGPGLSKADINSRDLYGLTVLLRAASSTAPTASSFVQALLDHPAIDLYAQDVESGWNALHRALYNGNIGIAIRLLEKERRDLVHSLAGSAVKKVGQLIKTKDHEGNSPFDVYNASIALRTLRMDEDDARSETSESDDGLEAGEHRSHPAKNASLGSELFTMGSNKNLSLATGDGDDRQYPERIYIQRPKHLVRYFHDNFLEQQKLATNMDDSVSLDSARIPALIQNRPLAIQDVVMAKLHTALLTTDPISNLYISGVGRAGRLGLGDEETQFSFQPVQGGLVDKKVVQVALGTNHSMAITDAGALYTWGSNKDSQLGYVLPTQNEESMSLTPRQVFGPLKKEIILGIAASSCHSVAFTPNSLYCWGRNQGQLALMDADSRSLETQCTPRKVAATLLASHGDKISMVTAIDRATACLFEDHSVCVFTRFGYSMVKFPHDQLTNSPFQRSGSLSLSSRYDPGRREIRHITSGGETIACLSGAGDVFTLGLSEGGSADKLNTTTATSTTNPSKIRDSLTTPQLIWSSRKDGANSVGVGENGSVILCTFSGAAWRRVKRVTAKDTKFPSSDKKRKDFKFQRVPYITSVAAARASPFGSYALIRKDCDITREQIEIDPKTLQEDISPLCSLRDFAACNDKKRENKDTWRFHNPDVLLGHVEPLAYEVLTSTDLEDDMEVHLRNWKYANEDTGLVVSTSTAPELQIPVHSWVISARAPAIRSGLSTCVESGQFDLPEVLSIRKKDSVTMIEFHGIDLITLLNWVAYCYLDEVIPAWNFTRQSPPLAYRYRQVRTELMKVASKLGMLMLEQDVRKQRDPGPSMDQDYKLAISDMRYFDDADTILDLSDGEEAVAHSALLCQRCPFFDGMFNGRSNGAWLSDRRRTSEKVHIDLKHVDVETFQFILRHLYHDAGEEIFDDVVAGSIDEFSELVLDVLNCANELMLDRLSQVCQKILGRFVSTRNISTLLNLVSPCSVTEFKDKGLEYICLSMESMLENHLLDNLDEALLVDLDEVVRDNQLARCPFARSGRAELLLNERHPELKLNIEDEKWQRLYWLTYKASQKEDERKVSSSLKARFGSLDDTTAPSPPPEKLSRKPKAANNEAFSPDLRPKDANVDLMFDMDDDPASPSPWPRPLGEGYAAELDHLPELPGPRRDWKGKTVSVADFTASTSENSKSLPSKSPSSQGGKPWGSVLPTPRLDLSKVMTTEPSKKSNLSAKLAAEKDAEEAAAAKAAPQKMSQKDRKRLLQQQAVIEKEDPPTPQQSQTPWAKVGETQSRWKETPAPPKASLAPPKVSPGPSKGPSVLPGVKPLVLEEASSAPPQRRAASPDTKWSGQRSGSSTPREASSRSNNGVTPAKAGPSQALSVQSAQAEKPLVPHSKSYMQKAPKRTEFIGLNLAEIIREEKRSQESVKDFAAKRSLQEIQQEQEFDLWWEQESRRAQEEEARKAARGKAREGRGKRGKAKGSRAQDASGAGKATGQAAAGPSTGGPKGRGQGNRGTKA